MAIRPVDMKNLMPKTQQLSRIQQMENDRHKNFVHMQNNNQTKETKKQLSQVKNSEKTTKTKITKDNRKNNNNKKQKNNENNGSSAHEEKTINKDNLTSVLGVNIDIKI